MAEFVGATMRSDIVGVAPTTNAALALARMSGFRAAKAGRKTPILGHDDPYNMQAAAWGVLGSILRRRFNGINERHSLAMSTAKRLEVEWTISMWSSRADAGSGTMIAKWLGDGFFGGGGHGDHRVFRESVEVVPLAKAKGPYVTVMIGTHQ